MKTEEYIIIVAVTRQERDLKITYTSKASAPRVTFKIVYSNGQIVGEQRNINQGENMEVLISPVINLLPGTYRCAAYFDKDEVDGKNFSIH